MKCSHFLLRYTMGFIKRNIFSSHTYLLWQRNVIEAFVKIIICWIMICDVNVSYVTPIIALIWCTDILQKFSFPLFKCKAQMSSQLLFLFIFKLLFLLYLPHVFVFIFQFLFPPTTLSLLLLTTTILLWLLSHLLVEVTVTSHYNMTFCQTKVFLSFW